LTEVFYTAVLGRPIGLNGFVRIKSFSGEYGHMAAFRELRLELSDGAQRHYHVEAFDEGRQAVKLEGVDTPEAAKTFANARVMVERAQAAPVRTDEFYIEDLKGLKAMGPAGEDYGVITDAVEGGGGFLLEVEIHGGKRVFVPFRNEFVGKIDVKAGFAQLVADWVLDG
jgi:16S rRNA processing protein RimM